MSEKLMEVLFVEDNPADVRLLREGLSDCKEWCTVKVAENGAQALDMLFRRGKYKDFVLPHLILLDINLPILSGIEVLTALKANHQLGLIPVVILSTSENPADINAAYDLGASCYIVKPRTLEHLTRICAALRDFWFDRVTLPKVLAARS